MKHIEKEAHFQKVDFAIYASKASNWKLGYSLDTLNAFPPKCQIAKCQKSKGHSANPVNCRNDLLAFWHFGILAEILECLCPKLRLKSVL